MQETGERVPGTQLPKEGQLVFDLLVGRQGWQWRSAWGMRIGHEYLLVAQVNSRWDFVRYPQEDVHSYVDGSYGIPYWIDLRELAYFLATLPREHGWWESNERSGAPGVQLVAGGWPRRLEPVWPDKVEPVTEVQTAEAARMAEAAYPDESEMRAAAVWAISEVASGSQTDSTFAELWRAAQDALQLAKAQLVGALCLAVVRGESRRAIADRLGLNRVTVAAATKRPPDPS